MERNKTNYFPHDTNASIDPKIISLRVMFGWKAIGMYWAIIEALHKEKNGNMLEQLISILILDLYKQDISDKYLSKEAKEFESYLYTSVLLEKKDGYTTSKRVQKNFDKIAEKSQQARGAIKGRWDKETLKQEENIRTNNGRSTDDIPKKEKKRKEKERERVKVFTPPTSQQIEEYCKERNNGIDAERFVNFYSAKGWMIGKNKMKDWKAGVRAWEQKNKIDNKDVGIPIEQRRIL